MFRVCGKQIFNISYFLKFKSQTWGEPHICVGTNLLVTQNILCYANLWYILIWCIILLYMLHNFLFINVFVFIGILFFISMRDHLQNMKLPQHNEIILILNDSAWKWVWSLQFPSPQKDKDRMKRYNLIIVSSWYRCIMTKKFVCLEFSDGLERFKCSNQVFLVALYRNQTLIYAALSTVHILHF